MVTSQMIVLLILVCLSDALKYIGGNLNWQPSLEKNNKNRIMIVATVNWTPHATYERALCDTTSQDPRMDITEHITLENMKPKLTNFTYLRCSVEIYGGETVISVSYRKSYIKPDLISLRMIGKLDSRKRRPPIMWKLGISSRKGAAAPPIAAAPPFVALCYDSQNPLTHYVQAVHINHTLVQKCRWSTNVECKDICATEEQKNTFTLKEDCSFTYHAKKPVREHLQVLAITVESFRSSDNSNVVSSTNLHFSVKEVSAKCPNYSLEFSSSVKQGKFFQEECSSEELIITFDAKSFGVPNSHVQVLRGIKMVNGPPGSMLNQPSIDTDSSPMKALYSFTWKATGDCDGTHPICFAVTLQGQTMYECSTLTLHGSNSIIPKTPCVGRSKCEANMFCVPNFAKISQQIDITSIPPWVNTTQPTINSLHQLSSYRQQLTASATIDSKNNTQHPTSTTLRMTGSSATKFQPWMIAFPLGLLALLAVVVVLSALLIRTKRMKAGSKVKEVDDYVEPDDDYVHNHRPAVQLRKFSLIPEIMPNAIPLPKPSYSAMNRTPLRLFPKQN